jgi:hypothetical protein
MRPGFRNIASILTLALVILAVSAAPARADVTAFIGLTPTPDRHALKGFSVGAGMIIIGFEFEFAHIAENTADALTGLKTYSGNFMVQTPTSTQLYVTTGVEAYRENLGDFQETYFGTNIGGGVKAKLAGPLRIRADYRIFKLQGSPIHDVYQRFYVGANLKF